MYSFRHKQQLSVRYIARWYPQIKQSKSIKRNSNPLNVLNQTLSYNNNPTFSFTGILQKYFQKTNLDDGACTDHPKSAILRSEVRPSRRFSGLMSRCITFLLWQYFNALANWYTYCKTHNIINSIIMTIYLRIMHWKKCQNLQDVLKSMTNRCKISNEYMLRPMRFTLS
jgi:hypothetical protein